MMVYVAYALLVLHVTFGVLQGEGSPIFVGAMGLGLVTVVGLHLVAGFREAKSDVNTEMMNVLEAKSLPASDRDNPLNDGYMDACAVADIPENRARIVCLSGERVAVFKYEGKISAISNVCQHQNGPLGEGKIVYGCITCPWHGYQYQPDTGASPPPFAEKVPTFKVRVRNGRVFVHPAPHQAGTRAEPALIEAGSQQAKAPSAKSEVQQPAVNVV
jgi:nitrite reductase/ring-hydroxylating ferredoxin subunit